MGLYAVVVKPATARTFSRKFILIIGEAAKIKTSFDRQNFVFRAEYVDKFPRGERRYLLAH